MKIKAVLMTLQTTFSILLVTFTHWSVSLLNQCFGQLAYMSYVSLIVD